MDEVVLFNPGDSIGNFHDYKQAVSTAQIYREQHVDSGHMLVVKSEHGEPSFDIFISEQQLDNGQSSFKPAKRYTVSKKL